MKSISALRVGDLEKVFENELAPQTQNHYFLDTYNKIRIDALQAAVDGFAKEFGKKATYSASRPDVLSISMVKGALVERLKAMVSVGASNAKQVVCLPLSPINPDPYRLCLPPELSFSPPFLILVTQKAWRLPFPLRSLCINLHAEKARDAGNIFLD